MFGKSATNKNKHGLDDRRNRKLDRPKHVKAISTVLQSKWRCMKIVVGLEDGLRMPENRVKRDRTWVFEPPGLQGAEVL